MTARRLFVTLESKKISGGSHLAVARRIVTGDKTKDEKSYCYTFQLKYVLRLKEIVSRVMGQNSLTYF